MSVEYINKIKDVIESEDRPYLIAEIGINHNGDLGIAKKLLDATFVCGWDCAKFQKRDPDICIPEKQKNILKKTPWGEMSYLQYKHKIEFQKKEYDYIDNYCKQKPLDWSVSVWDLNSLKFSMQYDLPLVKIPSAHFTNLKLIRAISDRDNFFVLSTGMTNWEMIDETVNILEQKNTNYALLHCNSTYPAPYNELNLSVIPEMKKRFGCIIGYSGHEYDLEPTVIAVGLGAEIIERHITLDHKMWGTDQESSLEVHAMYLLKKRIEEVKQMIGIPEKFISNSEKSSIQKLRG